MNDQQTTTASTTYVPNSPTACPVPQACGSRLPCGLCLITNQRCPMMPYQPIITWTSSDGLYNPQNGPTCTALMPNGNTHITTTINTDI